MIILKDLGPGATLGKYRFIRELGRGGMGVVYLVEDTLLQREVALKLLKPALSEDETFTRRFREEARSIARLVHPNVVHVNSFEALEEHLVIDMEYVDGYSLNHFFTQRVLTPQRVAAFTHDILHGLLVCHEIGVIHRDIKPTNILMTTSGRAKVGDFGVATAYASHMEEAIRARASSSFYLGTPRYAPPEIWEGAEPTPAWDLYSVGVLMYEALTGSAPYDASSPYAIIKQMQTKPLTPISEAAPSISPEMGALVHELLEHKPEDRIPSAAKALEQLHAAPEFSCDDLLEMPTIQVARTHIRIPIPGSSAARAERWRVSVYLLLGLVLAGLTFALVNLHLGSGPKKADVKSPPPAKAQELLLDSQLLTKDEILNSPKSVSSSGYWVFDTTVLETGVKHESHWLMDPYRPEHGATIYAATNSTLWLLSSPQSQGGQLVFQGYWAEYRDEGGTVFHEGTVAGAGLWTVPDRQLTASLTFTDSNDNSTWLWTVVAVRRMASSFDSTFIYALEGKPLLQPLLYHELLPRRYAWAQQFEALLPSVSGASVMAPAINNAVTDFVLDGQLKESFWRDSFKNGGEEIGRCPGVPFGRKSQCLVRETSSCLLVALAVPYETKTPLSVEIALLPGYSIPVKDSPYIIVRGEHGVPLSAHVLVKSVEIRYDCGWQMVDYAENGMWTAEIAIPFSSAAKVCPALGPEPWRMNIVVREAGQQKDQRRVVARWGFPELNEVIHGMKVSFQTPPTVSGTADLIPVKAH